MEYWKKSAKKKYLLINVCVDLVLLVISDQEVVAHEQNILHIQSKTFVVQQATLLRMIIGLKVIVQHVEAVECLLCLLAKCGYSLVDLIDNAVLCA